MLRRSSCVGVRSVRASCTSGSRSVHCPGCQLRLSKCLRTEPRSPPAGRAAARSSSNAKLQRFCCAPAIQQLRQPGLLSPPAQHVSRQRACSQSALRVFCAAEHQRREQAAVAAAAAEHRASSSTFYGKSQRNEPMFAFESLGNLPVSSALCRCCDLSSPSLSCHSPWQALAWIALRIVH